MSDRLVARPEPTIEPDPRMVADVEELLARVKRGEVVALAYATVAPDGTGATMFHYGGEAIALVGIVALLAHRTQAQLHVDED